MKNKISIIFVLTILLSNFIIGSNVLAKPSKEDKVQAQEFYLSGVDAYKNNQIAQSAQYFMEAVKLDAENPLYNLLAGDMLKNLKQYPSANRYYDAALAHAKKTSNLNKKIYTYVRDDNYFRKKVLRQVWW